MPLFIVEHFVFIPTADCPNHDRLSTGKLSETYSQVLMQEGDIILRLRLKQFDVHRISAKVTILTPSLRHI